MPSAKYVAKDVFDKVKEFTGILKSYDKEKIVVEIEGNDSEYLRSDLASVKLHVEF